MHFNLLQIQWADLVGIIHMGVGTQSCSCGACGPRGPRERVPKGEKEKFVFQTIKHCIIVKICCTYMDIFIAKE